MGLIREGASSRLFHFLNGCHLLGMLRRGSMRTCAPESYGYSGGRRFIDVAGVRYMSFTRNKNAGEGYPLLKYGGVGNGDDKFICRVELDGDYLSSHNLRRSDGRRRGGYEDVRVRFRPMDFSYYDYGGGVGDKDSFEEEVGLRVSNGKEWMMQSDSEDYFYPRGRVISDKHGHPMSQAEDRLTSRSEYIPSIEDYVRRVDVYIHSGLNRKDLMLMRDINREALRRGIPVYFYTSFDGFNCQRGRNYSYEEIKRLIR